MATIASYADVLMQEWGMAEQSGRLQASFETVLSELTGEACLLLRDTRLEVAVLPRSITGAWDSVWAFFPIHRRRLVARRLKPKPETRILLVICPATAETEPSEAFEVYLRDHIGHVLLYLRDPKARNECADAERQWRMSVKAAPAKAKRPMRKGK